MIDGINVMANIKIPSGQAISLSQSPKSLIKEWRKKNAIGIVSPNYASEKVSYGCGPINYTYHKVHRLPFHRFEKEGTFWKFTPMLLDHAVEIVHVFNELPLGIRPFVVSFENELPRYLGKPHSWQTDIGLNLLSSSRCKNILALSEIAGRNLKEYLTEVGLVDVASKVNVFRGTTMIDSVYEENTKVTQLSKLHTLKLLFVGRDPFGKGLLPCLDALDDCRRHGASVKVTIVCNFETRDYISKGRNPDVEALLARLKADPDIIHHYLLPNREIHRLMHSHDIFLFPTMDESLGWVAVEAAMASMPVIATDIYAIPELIKDGVTGFLIPLQKNETSRWIGLWAQGDDFDNEVKVAFASIRDGMTRHILEFARNPEKIAIMGMAAKAHIENLYSNDSARARLGDIYARALV